MSENSESRVEKSDIWDAVSMSGVLGSSKNQIALFKFLLDHKFNVPASELKTKNIAIKVFDRDESFSAKKDSIVRVEMFRLRANLNTFNQQSQALKVKLPKSSYELEVESLTSTNAVVPDIKAQKSIEKQSVRKFFGAGLAAIAGTFIFITTAAFNSDSKKTDCSNVMPNLEITQSNSSSNLDEYVHHVVKGAASQFSHFNIFQNAKFCTSSNVPMYKLEYILLQSDAGFQGSLSVLLEPNGKIVGVDNFSGASNEREDLYFVIAKITNDLLKPNGVVHRDAVIQNWKNPSDLEDYSCLLKMYESFVSDADSDYYEGLKCLESAAENDAASLDNLGGLAASYLDQALGNRDTGDNEPLIQAKLILDSVGDKWLHSQETTIAKIMYDTVREDYNSQRLRETLLQAEKTYTSHPQVINEIAKYSGFMLGEWGSAVKIMDRAIRLTSDQDNSVYQIYAASAVLGEGGAAAWINCLKAYSEHSKVSNLLVHACALKYEEPVWQSRTAENLKKLGIFSYEDKRSFVKSMGFEERLSEELLRKPNYNLYD